MTNKTKRILLISVIVLLIVVTNIIVINIMLDNKKPEKVKVIEQEEDTLNEEDTQQGEIFGSTGEDIKEVKKSNPTEREVVRNVEKKPVEPAEEVIEMPEVFQLMRGEWVAIVSGFKQGNRYLILENDTYTETLGNSLLKGGRVNMASDPEEERTGTYKFNVVKGKWSGDIIFDNGVTSRFIYGEIEGGEPFLEIIPNLTLIRRDFQEDYMNDPNFEYPTPKD